MDKTQCSPIQQYRQAYQIFNIPIFDWLVIGFASWVMSTHGLKDIHPVRLFLILTIISLITHFVLKKNTMLGYYLGLNPDPRSDRPSC